MSSVRIQTGATEPIEMVALDDSLDPLTGKADILLAIRRKSDNFFLDFHDNAFKASGWTTRQQAMSEISATNAPGEYAYNWNTSTIVSPVDDDTYELAVTQSPGTDVANVPQTGEIKLGQFVDDIDAAISSRGTADPGDEMNLANDAITAAKHDETTSYPLAQSDAGTSAVARTGADGDTLETLSDQIDGTATPGAAMDLVTDAVDSNALAASAVTEMATGVWASGTRTLTSFGTLVADVATAVWGAATRTLSSFGTLVADIDTQLSSTHGGGLWDATATPITQQQVRDAMKLAPTGGAPAAGSVDEHLDDIDGKTTNLPTDPADQSQVEAAISTSEGNIRGGADTLDTLSAQLDVVQADLDIPGQYKADVSALALEANVEGHAADALTAYDPPTHAEMTAEHGTLSGEHTGISALIVALNDLSSADIQAAMTAQGYTTGRAAMIELSKKMLINRLELADGSSGNWILYDDNDVDVLLTFGVTDKNSLGIIQAVSAPAKRTRGV